MNWQSRGVLGSSTGNHFLLQRDTRGEKPFVFSVLHPPRRWSAARARTKLERRRWNTRDGKRRVGT